MALVVPNASEVEIIKYIMNITAPTDLTARLYSNDHDPDESTTEGLLTEVAGSGYVSQPLSPGNWVITPGNPSVAEYSPEIVWTFTGAVGNVYGYYVTRLDGTLMWAERFSNGPFNVQVAGSKIEVTLRFTAE